MTAAPDLHHAAWLEGTRTERFANAPRDADGMRELLRQFSFRGGIPGHAAPEPPGSIHEGGEPGYARTSQVRGDKEEGTPSGTAGCTAAPGSSDR